jgi:hypothetical protein
VRHADWVPPALGAELFHGRVGTDYAPGVAQLHLAQHEEADRLISEDPLALLIGMVLDQQIGIQSTQNSS